MNRTLVIATLILGGCGTTEGDLLLDFRDAGGTTAPRDAGSVTIRDAGPHDAGTRDASAEPVDAGPPFDCAGNPPTFPTFDRSCTTAQDCATGTRQLNCCGSLGITGINASEEARYAAAAALCNSQYPECGCPSFPTVADDGTSDTGYPAQVSCVQSTCTTTFPAGIPCGQTTCTLYQEVCVARSAGPGFQYVCEPLPAACLQDQTCNCLASTICQAPYDVCGDVSRGHIECICPQCR